MTDSSDQAKDALIDLEAWVKDDDKDWRANERREPYEQAKKSPWFEELFSHTA